MWPFGGDESLSVDQNIKLFSAFQVCFIFTRVWKIKNKTKAAVRFLKQNNLKEGNCRLVERKMARIAKKFGFLYKNLYGDW